MNKLQTIEDLFASLADPTGNPFSDVECATVDPELWWLDDERHIKLNGSSLEGIKLALTICNRCPVADKCLELSLTDDLQWGIWGGYLAGERYVLTGQTRAGFQQRAILRAKQIRQITGVPMRGQDNETNN